MDRRTLPHAHVTPALLMEFIYLRLQDHTHALHQKYTAQHRYQQLLVDQHGTHTDDTADCQTAGIAHEDLRGETVPPQISDQRTDEGSQKDYQLFRMGNIHHIKIVRPHHAAAHIRQHNECYSDDSRVAGTHTVHAVVEIGTIAHRCHHKHRQ